MSEAARSMREIAQGDGDLTRRLDVRGGDEFGDLAQSFNLFTDKIHGVLKRVAGMSAELSETSCQVTDAAVSSDHGMTELRGNTQTVVVATEELSVTAREVAGSASKASSASAEANGLAQEGREVVQNSVRSINSFAEGFDEAAVTILALRSETENIGGILDVIRAIAEQTNLLVLNAAIEAARAGEQGRGFAVVADEVRTLAHRSRTSTNEIQDLIARLHGQAESAVGMIERSQSRITDTVGQAERAGDALQHIFESVGLISAMTEQIATAAEEQPAVVVEIASNVVGIDELAQRTSGEADNTAELMARLSEVMAGVTSEIKHIRFDNDELLTLSQAKAAHFDWKARLRSFLDGDSHLTSDQVASHEHCELGRWYYAEGIQRFGDSAECRAIEQPHKAIHKMIREVVEAKERGDMVAAEARFTEVTDLSGEVITCLDSLARAIQ